MLAFLPIDSGVQSLLALVDVNHKKLNTSGQVLMLRHYPDRV